MRFCCLDLDRFKEVNDLFGHAAGDADAAEGRAAAPSSVLRHGQMLARLGGDEFAIIAPDLPDPQAAGRIAEALLAAMREENRVAAGGGLVSASIGIALYPLDADDQTSLISHADTALYRAKTEGRDTYRYFEASMGAEARDKRVHGARIAPGRGARRILASSTSRKRRSAAAGWSASKP